MVTLSIKNIDKVTEQLALGKARPRIRMALRLSGDAAAYSAVWEWGRINSQPGPKTLWGTNPDGETTVLTKTAPFGYIRVNKASYRQYIREEVKKINFHTLKPSQWNHQLELALRRAAKRCAQLISDTAPIDTGELRDEILEIDVIDEMELVDTLSQKSGFTL